MLHIKRENQPVRMQPGRKCHNAVSPEDKENTAGLMAAFAEFSYKYGVMDTHYHQNEYMYIIDAHNAVVKHGFDLDNLVTETLCPGEIIRPVDGEWHRFDFISDDGYVDFLNFFAEFPPRVVNSADLKNTK